MARIHKSTRLDETIVKRVTVIAEKEQRSFSNMLEVILTEYLDDSPVKRVPEKTSPS